MDLEIYFSLPHSFIPSFLSEVCLYSMSFNVLTEFSSVCFEYTIVFDDQYS